MQDLQANLRIGIACTLALPVHVTEKCQTICIQRLVNLAELRDVQKPLMTVSKGLSEQAVPW